MNFSSGGYVGLIESFTYFDESRFLSVMGEDGNTPKKVGVSK